MVTGEFYAVRTTCGEGDKWYVSGPGMSRAYGVFDSQEDAEEAAVMCYHAFFSGVEHARTDIRRALGVKG